MPGRPPIRTLAIAAGALALAGIAGTAAADPATACAPAAGAWESAAASGDVAAMRAAMRSIPGVCTQLLARARAGLAAAGAQNDRAPAPAPPPAGRAESLSDILGLIENDLIGQGPVAFEGFAHDSDPAPGKVANWTYTKRMEYTGFSYDLASCDLHFHFKLMVNGDVSTDKDAGVPLRSVSGVKVALETELLKIRDAQGGHPTYSSRLEPVIYDVDVTRGDGGVNEFSFYSLQTARHVARLFEAAAERCGATSISHY